MMVLFRKNHLSGMTNTCLQKCAHCLVGKQNRVAFKTRPSSSRNENLLDLVHSSLYGQMKVKILGGSLYFVTFIDDHSKKICAYTLSIKIRYRVCSSNFRLQLRDKLEENLNVS